ncbi:MAG: transglutaminase family protein [Bdellovibrionia bacterium]
MRLIENYKSGLTYMMAAVMTAAPAFHIGDSIEIETLLNGRSDKNFLSDQESIKRYVATQLPKGTLGEIEEIHGFKKTGNTGLYIKVTSGPNAGKKYWVLHRPDRNYLKLYDKKSKETDSAQDAAKLETQQDISAVHDRQPASKAQGEAQAAAQASETSIPEKVLNLSLFVKSAGESPKADCSNTDAPKQDMVPVAELPQEKAELYLRSSPRVQTSDPRIQELAQSITSGKSDDYSKAMAIHDWVASNVEYDTEAYFKEFLNGRTYTREYDALSVLNRTPHTAVCAGYTNLALALMRASNIPAREIEGLVHYDGPPETRTCVNADKQKNYHAWLEVWVNGRWLAMDTTADAGNTDYKTETFIKSPSRKFMDLDVFWKSHTPCSINNYY